jgi:ribosome biogenesis GTPase
MPDGTVRRCTLKGKKLRGADGSWAGFYNPLAPGDMVELDDGGDQIAALEPRQNAFTRWNEKGRAPQVLAANVDLAVMVTTPDEPPFRPRFIDRALVQAAWCRIAPLIVVNKADLPVDDEMESRLAVWVKLGYRVLRVSAKSGAGVAKLAENLAGKTSVFVGQSGVGKSSLINALGAQGQRVGAISEKWGRGSHTTTQGILLRLSTSVAHFCVIDTPGVRRFVLHGPTGRDVVHYFPEMAPLALKCQFGASCTHTVENGCAILAALKKGTVHPDRYESLMRMVNEKQEIYV